MCSGFPCSSKRANDLDNRCLRRTGSSVSSRISFFAWSSAVYTMMHEAEKNSLNPALTVLQQQCQRLFSNIEISAVVSTVGGLKNNTGRFTPNL